MNDKISAAHLADYALRHPEDRSRIAEAKSAMDVEIRNAELRTKQQHEALVEAEKELARRQQRIYDLQHPMSVEECLANNSSDNQQA